MGGDGLIFSWMGPKIFPLGGGDLSPHCRFPQFLQGNPRLGRPLTSSSGTTWNESLCDRPRASKPLPPSRITTAWRAFGSGWQHNLGNNPVEPAQSPFRYRHAASDAP